MPKKTVPPHPFGADGGAYGGYTDPRAENAPDPADRVGDDVHRAAADILLGRADDMPHDGSLRAELDSLEQHMRQTRKAKIAPESLADRLRREATAAAAERTAEEARVRATCDAEAAEAAARADGLHRQLRSLDGVWVRDVPRRSYGADGEPQLTREEGRLATRLVPHVRHEADGVRLFARYAVLVCLVRGLGSQQWSMMLVEWSTGWVNPRGHHGSPFWTAGWVINDYNSSMADRPLLVGQKPVVDGRAIEVTLDLLRQFVVPDRPPVPLETDPPAQPPGRPGLDL